MDTIENTSPAATTESAPVAAPSPPDAQTAAPDTDPSAPPAPKETKTEDSRWQKRIDQLTRQRYDEQRAREAAEAKLAQHERQQTLSRQFSELDAQAPRIDQFQDLPSYQLAMSNWTTQKATAIAMAQWEERQQQQEAQRAQQAQQYFQQQQRLAHENATLEQKMQTGAKKYPDFMQVVTSQDIGSVRNTPLFSLILEADNAADIAYALAKNPGEIDRLLSLPHPAAMARAIFQLDRQFAGNAVTTAPPPPPSRNGGAPVQSGMPDPKNTAAWMKWREEQERSKYRRR